MKLEWPCLTKLDDSFPDKQDMTPSITIIESFKSNLHPKSNGLFSSPVQSFNSAASPWLGLSNQNLNWLEVD
jgi:hypothetical protein